MGKKMHPGSGAVIGAQLVILLILTASLCVQSRKAAAENTYAIMEESGGEKKDYIHWVEFTVPAEVMQKAFRLDHGKYPGGCSSELGGTACISRSKIRRGFRVVPAGRSRRGDGKLKSGVTMEELTKDMKYYAYYREAYGAVLDGMVGYFEQETETPEDLTQSGTGENGNAKTVWLRKYGLKAFSPIAKNFPYSDFDDFGASRSYGFKRKHLGHDMMGQVGTPVIAVESGYVEALGWNQYGGWRIGIRSFDKKRYYYYAHLRQNYPYQSNLKEGSIVTAGDVIGYLGRTGYSTTENTNNITTPHLHFGIQLIFDESQKEGNNEIWIDCYEIVKFLRLNQSETVKVEGTKEWTRVYGMKDPDVPGEEENSERGHG